MTSTWVDATPTGAPVPPRKGGTTAAPFEAYGARRRSVLGAPVDLVDRDGWVYCVGRWLSDGTPGTAVGVNANLVNLARADAAFAASLNEVQLAYADGQAVVWAARALGWPVSERLATTDMVEPLAELLVERGAAVFLLGGEPGLAAEAAVELQRRHPGLRVAGTHHGFVSAEDDAVLVAAINASRAQVLLVGMGDPLQQAWVQRNRANLAPVAVLTCGGLFNWVTGRQRRPADWIVRAGLEWAWRLVLEPRRLWRRYVLGNPVFVAALLRELLRDGRRPAAPAPDPVPVAAVPAPVPAPTPTPAVVPPGTSRVVDPVLGAVAHIPHQPDDAAELPPLESHQEDQWS